MLHLRPIPTCGKVSHQSTQHTIILNPYQSLHIPTNNQFSALSADGDDVCVEHTEVSVQPRTPQPPPVFIYGVINYMEMVNIIANLRFWAVPNKSLIESSVKISTNQIRFDAQESYIWHQIIYHSCQVKVIMAYILYIE